MLSEKMKALLTWPLLLMPLVCLIAGCRGVAPKAQEPSAAVELQLQEAKEALSAKEEDNASLTRQLEAARQARQREQEELTKEFEQAKALLEERIATLSRELSQRQSESDARALETSPITAGGRERDELRAIKPRLAETEAQRTAAVRELQAAKQLLAAKERETAELAKQVEAAKRVPPPKEPPYTKTQEPARPVSDRHPILDKLSGIASWVWIATAILIVMLLYLLIRPSTGAKEKGKT
jgi:hypothetical protein